MMHAKGNDNNVHLSWRVSRACLVNISFSRSAKFGPSQSHLLPEIHLQRHPLGRGTCRAILTMNSDTSGV